MNYIKDHEKENGFYFKNSVGEEFCFYITNGKLPALKVKTRTDNAFFTFNHFEVKEMGKFITDVLGKKPNPDFVQKPPIGIMPNHIWLTKRIAELKSAIDRHEADNVNVQVPYQWIGEMNWLLHELTKSCTNISKPSFSELLENEKSLKKSPNIVIPKKLDVQSFFDFLHKNDNICKRTAYERMGMILIAEAKSKGFKEGIKIKRDLMSSNTDTIVIPKGDKFFYDFHFDILYLNEKEIYNGGIWATIAPKIVIPKEKINQFLSERNTKLEKDSFDSMFKLNINSFASYCYNQSKEAGWHDKDREIGTMLMLIVSEIAEAMEGDRKDLMDDHLPHRKMLEVELADAVIRIGDLAGKYNLDLGGAIDEKLAYNRNREDHKKENRSQKGGKKY